MNKDNLKAVLVTSGPTRAYFDSVRYIANKSSGALGVCIVEEFLYRGVPVIHIKGSGSIMTDVKGNRLYTSIKIETLNDLETALEKVKSERRVSAVVHAMAVLDYIPESIMEDKKSSDDDYWDIRLVKTPKYIGIMRELFPEAFFVGFKLESGLSEEQLKDKAIDLLRKNNIDVVVANDIRKVGAEHHEAIFVNADGSIFRRAKIKARIAEAIADIVVKNIKK